jgi:hypothetical protein
MAVAGHSRTTASSSTPQLALNAAGTFYYGWLAKLPESDTTPDTLLFRQDAVSKVTQTFDPATITGNPFNLPLGIDAHFVLATMPDLDERLWVIGNGHAQPFRFGYTTWPPNTSSTWTFPSFASMPYSSIGADIHTYSQMFRQTDGTLLCCMEQEENAGYEKRIWSLMKLAPHSTSWAFVNPSSPILMAGNHPAASNEPDRCYMNMSLIGTRLHTFNVFARVDEPGPTGLFWRQGHTYMYSDPPYTTWKAIDGTTITLPLTWANKGPALITGTNIPTYSVTGAAQPAVDKLGNPHFIFENTQADGNPGSPTYYEVYYTGTAWLGRSVFAPGSSVGPGVCTVNGNVVTITSAVGRMRLRDPVTNQAWLLGGPAPNAVRAVPDPIGVRDGTRLTFLVADGDTPVIFTLNSPVPFKG